jgi:hypothetical protein
MGGDETAFLAVEAYDKVDCDALEVFEAWLGMEVDCETEVICGICSKMTSLVVCFDGSC